MLYVDRDGRQSVRRLKPHGFPKICQQKDTDTSPGDWFGNTARREG